MRRVLILSIATLLTGFTPALTAGLIDQPFLRGDVNQDGDLDLADPIATLNFLFLPGSAPLPCDDAADANDDGTIDCADTIFTLIFLFLDSTNPIPPPYGELGEDPTFDLIGCGTVTCVDETVVAAGLSIITGTVPLPGVIPAQMFEQSGVTIETSAADAELSVDAVTYDAATHTFTVTGSAGAPVVPVTITAFTINVSCNVAITVDWSLTGSFDTISVAPGASEIIGVTPGSVVPAVTNPVADFSRCPGLGLISGILNGIFATIIEDALAPILPTIEGPVSDALDALIGTVPLIVCDASEG